MYFYLLLNRMQECDNNPSDFVQLNELGYVYGQLKSTLPFSFCLPITV